MRKAIRVDGRILLPLDPTDEEFDYALSMYTPAERERLARDVSRVLKWGVWRLKHPTLAGLLDAAYLCGLAMIRS